MKKSAFLLLILVMLIPLAACQGRCEHVYDNACDATCNLCTEQRTVSHDFLAADCTAPKTCKVCQLTEGAALGHSAAADDGDCTTPVTCTVCDGRLVEAKDHDFASEDARQTTDEEHWLVCANEGCEIEHARGAHTPVADDGDCTTALTCSACGAVTTAANAAHISENDDGDCTTPVTCTACDYCFVEAKDHVFAVADGWTATDTEHWHACLNEGCEATDTHGEHTPEADDGDCTTPILCSVCGWTTTARLDSHTPLPDGTCDVCGTALDYVYDKERMEYIVFTAEGLYVWVENAYKCLQMTIAKDIVMPTELRFDLDGDGTNDSNWPKFGFTGTVDGGGHSITGLIVKPAGRVDLMGFVSSLNSAGVIKNLRLLDADMRLNGINCGILVGYNNGRIENCSVSGSLSVVGNNVGGIVGSNNGTVVACYNAADISATVGIVGGIVGQEVDTGTIIACYNIGSITAGNTGAGGIAGNEYGSNPLACYNTGTVDSPYDVGALAGYFEGTLSACYASESSRISKDGDPKEGIAVDGETVSWHMAKDAMNLALEAAQIPFRYAENPATEGAVHPLILHAVP